MSRPLSRENPCFLSPTLPGLSLTRRDVGRQRGQMGMPVGTTAAELTRHIGKTFLRPTHAATESEPCGSWKGNRPLFRGFLG